jgi:hypothetical protein
MRRIGVLMATGETDPETKAYLSEFTQGLREAGLQSRAVRMDVRSASIDIDRTRMAKELIALQPDVIPVARDCDDRCAPAGDADDPDCVCGCI